MRTRVPLIALAAFLLCAHSACRRAADARNLATVDSLLLITDTLLTKVNALDMAGLARIDSLFLLRKDQVEARMRDTLSKEAALALGNYHRTMTKSLGRAQRDHGAVLKDLTLARTQLTALRNDVDKGLLEPGAEVKYISDERLALARARHGSDVVSASVASVLRAQDRYHHTVDSLLSTDTTASR